MYCTLYDMRHISFVYLPLFFLLIVILTNLLYFVNDCFMPDNHIMKNIRVIRHLPVHIIQGRHDVICPPASAHRLAEAWGSNATLRMIDDAGHSTFENGIAHALLSALDEFAI